VTLPAIGRLLRAIELDHALLWGLSGKLWIGVSGPITALLIARSFSPELQGYHYAFMSLLALQMVVELGLSNVISIFASHEWAALRIDPTGAIQGDNRARARLASILRFGSYWFGFGAVVVGIGLAGLGLLFFWLSPGRASEVAWKGPWIALCIGTALSVAVAPVWAILQGCNQVQQLNFYRLIESVLRSVSLWVALASGAGLWAAVIAAFAPLPWTITFLGSRYRRFLVSLLRASPSTSIAWRRDILPMQWRFAVSWLAGYLSFSLFTPALFWYQGPVVAGQMGMTWALVSGVSGLAATWVQVKAPELAMLIARREFHTLDRQVRRAGVSSFVAACAGGLLLLSVVVALDHYAPGLRSRLLPTLPIAIFVGAEALHQISMVQSTYLRSFKREPFLLVSVVSGLVVGSSTIICARFFSADGVALAYLAAILIALAWGTQIFRLYRREWTARA
jgi:O-antigen/teichoic acid export membrane protein